MHHGDFILKLYEESAGGVLLSGPSFLLRDGRKVSRTGRLDNENFSES